MFASRTLLFSLACLSSMSGIAATVPLEVAKPINMNESPPPWLAPDAPTAKAEKTPVEAQPENTAQEDKPLTLEGDVSESSPATASLAPVSGVATAPQAASSTSRMENWYRNRRQTISQPTTSLENLQASAQQNDANAQYELGMAYQSGKGVPQDMAQATQWLNKAAQGGNVRAQYALAMLYRADENADIKQSLEWQRKAAEAGHAEAQYGLGLLYANGQYLDKDVAQARNWFQQAAGQGHGAARLALLSLESGAPAAVASVPAETATASPEKLAAPDSVKPEAVEMAAEQASVQLAAVEPAPESVADKPAETPTGIPEADPATRPEPTVTTASLPSAAEETNASSELDLAGVDPATIRQSADAGDKQAQLMLGTLYEDGLGGLPSDLREAAYWYEQAAKQGYTKAQYNLGLLYEDGRGVKQDYAQAAYWYNKAAKDGFTEAQNNLGVLFILGKGVKQDKKKAEALFSDAASQGNANAQRNLDMLRKS